jgi:hypothetical protein
MGHDGKEEASNSGGDVEFHHLHCVVYRLSNETHFPFPAHGLWPT